MSRLGLEQGFLPDPALFSVAYQTVDKVLDPLWRHIHGISGLCDMWNRRDSIVSIVASVYLTPRIIWLSINRALQVGKVANNTNLLPFADTWLAAATACDIGVTSVYRSVLSM